jgi:hypothetical protein
MKTFTLTLLFLSCLVLASYSQDSTTTKKEKNKPKATYQIGSARVTVWENKGKDGSLWKNFEIDKVYQKEGKWLTSNHFNESELLELKSAIDKAIAEESVQVKKQ